MEIQVPANDKSFLEGLENLLHKEGSPNLTALIAGYGDRECLREVEGK
jgi:hypothetical protein